MAADARHAMQTGATAVATLADVTVVAVAAVVAEMAVVAVAAARVAVVTVTAETAAVAMAVAETAATLEAGASLPVVDPETAGTDLTRHHPSGPGRSRSAAAFVAAPLRVVPTDVVIPTSAAVAMNAVVAMNVVAVMAAVVAMPLMLARAAPSRIPGLPNAEIAVIAGTGPDAPRTGARVSRRGHQGGSRAGHLGRAPRDPDRPSAGREDSPPGPRC